MNALKRTNTPPIPRDNLGAWLWAHRIALLEVADVASPDPALPSTLTPQQGVPEIRPVPPQADGQ